MLMTVELMIDVLDQWNQASVMDLIVTMILKAPERE